ncbi:hypothetical protein ACN6AT_37710 (plasmid) [Streptomyces sp. JL4002]|uniref:hypothetical protein n=1 Tax=Streptomyces sp. JL4002 TaxID=3404781 RepID=UPI003B2852F7
MTRHLLRRCATLPRTVLSPKGQANVNVFRTLLAVLRTPEPWTSGCGRDIAVRVGAHIERARTRPGDDRGPDVIAVALVHPHTPHAAAYAQRYTGKGWLRCETATIVGLWQPAYTALTHAAEGLDLPDDVDMPPAHYGVDVEARDPDGRRFTLLRLGPYTQTWHSSRDADRLTVELEGQAATAGPGFTVTATSAPFDFSDRETYADPYRADTAVLLADTLTGAHLSGPARGCHRTPCSASRCCR